MSFSLASCHGKKFTGDVVVCNYEVPDSFDTSKTYNLTFWAKNDTNQIQIDSYKKAVSDFELLYPNIHITIKPYTDYQAIYADVITNIATGTTPNICITYPDHVATYLSGSEVVVPLNNLINNSKYGLGGSEVLFDSVNKDEVVTKFLNEGVINDLYYTLPFMRSSEALYINKDYVEDLGYTIPDVVTWDFIWEVSRKAMQEKEDTQTLIPFFYKSTDNMMIQTLYQKGIPYISSDGEIYLFDEVKDLIFEFETYANEKLFSTFKRDSYPGNWFNRGQVIFAIDSTAGSTWLGSDAPLMDIKKDTAVDFETVVRAVPQYDVDNPKMISQGPSICIFNKTDEQEVLASWLFAQFLLTNEVQLSYAETEGYVPVTNRAIESSEYQEYLSKSGEDNDLDYVSSTGSTNEQYYHVKISATKLVLDNIDNTFITPVFNGSASVRKAAGDLIENSFKKKYQGEGNYTKLISETKSLNKIDEIIKLNELNKNDSSSTINNDLGEMPSTAKVLLISLSVSWVLLGIYYIITRLKKKIRL